MSHIFILQSILQVCSVLNTSLNSVFQISDSYSIALCLVVFTSLCLLSSRLGNRSLVNKKAVTLVECCV
jgi:hypothetical protein